MKRFQFSLRLAVILLGIQVIVHSYILNVINVNTECGYQQRMEEITKEFRENPVFAKSYQNLNKKDRLWFENTLNSIRDDFKQFPVPKDYLHNVQYEDSWGNERTFGGNRTHEGTDLMSKTNIRGEIPVVSITEGTITNMGWLRLGGYRIGITSSNGIYYYYAHLYSYEPTLKKGDLVKPGQLLGFMGDSGYSDEEGAVGNFPVHLHIGIYITTPGGVEYSINPYEFLKKAETTQ